jgi:hypothetical protein
MEFPEGIRVFKPHEKAPDFVKANITINIDELVEYIGTMNQKELKLVVKESKKGTYYIAIDDFKPKKQDNSQPDSSSDEEEDDLPF